MGKCCREVLWRTVRFLWWCGGSVVGKTTVVEPWNHCCGVVDWSRQLTTGGGGVARTHSGFIPVCIPVHGLLFGRVVVVRTFAFRFVGCCFDVLSPLFFHNVITLLALASL